MTWRWGSRVFAPSVSATVATLLLLPCLISLGFWQLHRADYKRALMAQAAAGKAQILQLASDNVAKLNRYQHVTAQGAFDSAHQVLLDNMPAQTGQPGYRVLTPMQLTDGALVLIDRGWLPLGQTRKDLPNVEVSEAPRRIQGLLDELPQPGVRLGGPAAKPSSWPAVLNYPRYEELKAIYGDKLLPRIVLLDADEADGFDRHWQIDVGFGPERHIAYAVQWFGLALALLLIYFFTNSKRVESAHVR